jgi:hypothetical protein
MPSCILCTLLPSCLRSLWTIPNHEPPCFSTLWKIFVRFTASLHQYSADITQIITTFELGVAARDFPGPNFREIPGLRDFDGNKVPGPKLHSPGPVPEVPLSSSCCFSMLGKEVLRSKLIYNHYTTLIIGDNQTKM